MQSLPKNRVILLCCAVALVAGCVDNMHHRDSIALGVGDAPAANTAIHTWNTWPANVGNTVIVRKP